MQRQPTMTDASFQEYAGMVYGWAYRMLGRHHDALDVVQDVFVKWAQQCTQDRPQQPRGWLRRVTLNRALDVLRGKPVPVGLAMEPETAPAPRLVEPMDEVVLRADVSGAMAALSDAQRSVLIAKVYDGLTFAEIAGEMGVAIPTVKTHYLRALAGMRNRLRGRWAE